MAGASTIARLVTTILEAAQRAIDQGQWEEAADLARQVLDVVPGEPQAAALLATAAAHGRQGAADQGRRYLTVLFSDVVGSTPLSERLDAEDYFAVIAAYREVVREVIARHGGILDQFQGDGVLAYFGFPTAGEDDQVRAVEAGLDIVRAVPEAGARVGIDLQSRVGVHTGQTILTTSTLGMRGQSAAIGFATNVAARIQGVAEPGAVVVSETAADAVAPFFQLALIGAHQFRGVTEDVRVFRVYERRPRSTMGDARLSSPLVGRLAEQARIDDAWRAVREGGDDPRLIVLTGDPGIGKSRLARYAIERARADGNVIEINCGRDYRHVGLGAVRRGIEKALEIGPAPQPGDMRAALRTRAEYVGLAEDSRRVLESLVGDSDPAHPAPELTPDRLREAIITALIDWIAAEAETAALAVVVEDVHWADDTAVEALRRLTARPLPPGLLLLVTVRPAELPAALAGLQKVASPLGPLGTEDAREMVRAFAGRGELDDEMIDALARRGEGVPLFTEHLVMASTTSSGSSGAASASLPATLEGLLQVRLAASGAGRGVAEVAATIGREFTVELVARALTELGDRAPLPPSGVGSALRALERAGLVEADSDTVMRFRHALVRDVAYEMQLRAERPGRHEAVACAMVEVYGLDADPAALAFHLEQAGDLEPAASAYLRAAEAASDRAEFELALTHLGFAGDIIARLEGVTAHRLELARCMQIGAVSAASFSYARDEAEQAYLRALELCDLIGAEEGPFAGLDVQLISALGGLWSKEVVTGNLAKAAVVTDRLERVVPVAPAELAPEIRRFTLGCRGFEQLFAGQTTDAIETLRAASTMNVGPVAVPLGTPHDYVAAVYALLAAGLALAGDDTGADDAIANAVRRTTTLPFPLGPFSEAVVLVYSSYVGRLRGDVEAATRDAARIGAIGDQYGFREHSMLGQLLQLAAASIPGDPTACQGLENVLGMWRMAGGGLAVPALLAELADGWLRAGDTVRARTAIDAAATMMEETGQRGVEPEVLRIGARLNAASGAADDAVVKDLVAAADLALAHGSVRLAARAVRDAAAELDGRHSHAFEDVATRWRAQLPATAAGELREIERSISAPA